jgi:hypothetical protein
MDVLTEERLAADGSIRADRPIAFLLRPRRGIGASSDGKQPDVFEHGIRAGHDAWSTGAVQARAVAVARSVAAYSWGA